MIVVGFACELDISPERIRAFYQDNWARRIALSDETFYHWQFLQSPDGGGKDHCVVALDLDSAEILGVMGLSLRSFILDGMDKQGAELTTWIVSARSAGMGIGGKILRYIQESFDILIGMGISDMALPVYMRSGFRYIRAIPRFIKVLNFEKIKKYCEADQLAIKLLNTWKPEHKDTVDWSVRSVDFTIGENTLPVLAKHMNHFCRNEEYLRWRYSDHPYFLYKQWIVASGAVCAYVCLREETKLEEFRILHVMDLFGDQEAIQASLEFIKNYSLEHDFDVIDFYCTSSAIYRHLLADGWFSINDDTSFQFPHLFQPIEIRKPPTTSLVYWSKENMADMSDISRLYITKQDADLDRPTGYQMKSQGSA